MTFPNVATRAVLQVFSEYLRLGAKLRDHLWALSSFLSGPESTKPAVLGVLGTQTLLC